MTGTPTSQGRPGSRHAGGRRALRRLRVRGRAAALREVLAPLGGMAAFVRPGERIALKPNLLLGAAPEQAITTHPAVVAAVALEVKEAGAHPGGGGEPGLGGDPREDGRSSGSIARPGYREVAERYGFELNLDTDWEAVSFPEAAWCAGWR